MFGKMLKMEFVRAFRPWRILGIISIIIVLLLGSDGLVIDDIIKTGTAARRIGIIDLLQNVLVMDTFKVVFVILLSGLYVNSFCKDDNSKYLRMLLSRVDVTTYTQCRFIANACIIFVVSILSFYAFSIIMSPIMPLLKWENSIYSFSYAKVAEKYPVLYVGILGYLMGLVSAASSSVGMLFSSYKPNSFASIGMSGLVFYLAISYIPFGTPFNVLNLIGLKSTIGSDAPWYLVLLWTTVYMLSVVAICGVLFYRRMKWRMENGFV